MPPHEPPPCSLAHDVRVTAWLKALEARHLSDLRFAEVTRALRALSMAYVQRRGSGGPRAALDGAGKRAAFALFYAPLHLLATSGIITALGAAAPPLEEVLDLGCGTGAAGAAWALAASTPVRVSGIDRHPWAGSEARWTLAALGLGGRVRVGELPSHLPGGPGRAIVAAYLLNELADAERRRLEDALLQAARLGSRVLVLEPISRQATPWWKATAARLQQSGFRADEWRLALDRPAIVAKLDAASGLDHRAMAVRSLYHG